MTGEGDPADDQATPASMADLKLMETSLKSSMDTQFAEMRDLLKQLASGKVPTETIPLEDSANSNDGDTEEEKEKKKGVENTDLKNPSTSTTIPEGGKPEYHVVPLVYSPNPPIHQTRINPLGPPPKLNALAFATWQHLMKSHINSSSLSSFGGSFKRDTRP